jgi:hypothetical protein
MQGRDVKKITTPAFNLEMTEIFGCVVRLIRSNRQFDRTETVRPYRFKHAATLPEDVWAGVDKVLRDKGVI